MFTVTFYSFKGGVGRTLALMNVAIDLVKNGENVTVIDFDLEAPGLTTFDEFKKCNKKGVVDYVSEYIESWPNPKVPNIKNFLYQSNISSLKKHSKKSLGSLWIMPASKNADVKSINWRDLYDKKKGFYLFEELKEQIFDFTQSKYLLIDSRTGLTDHSSICTKQLPDLIVSIFFPNDQNINGMESVLSNIKRIETEQTKKPIIYVASRLPTGDDENGILEKQLDKAKNILKYTEQPVLKDYFTLHNNSRTDLIDQYLLIKEPSDRVLLKREYVELSQGIQTHNLESFNGSVTFLNNLNLHISKINNNELNLEFYMPRLDYICKHFHDSAAINLYTGMILDSKYGSRSSLRIFFHHILSFSIMLKDTNKEFSLNDGVLLKNETSSIENEVLNLYPQIIPSFLNRYEGDLSKSELCDMTFQEISSQVFSDKKFVLNSNRFLELDKALLSFSNFFISIFVNGELSKKVPDNLITGHLINAVFINFKLNYDNFFKFYNKNEKLKKEFFRNFDYLRIFLRSSNQFYNQDAENSFPVEFVCFIEDLIFDRLKFLDFFYKAISNLDIHILKKIENEFGKIPNISQIFLFERGMLTLIKTNRLITKSVRTIENFYNQNKNFDFFSDEGRPINNTLRLNLALKLLICSKILYFRGQEDMFNAIDIHIGDDNEMREELYKKGPLNFLEKNKLDLNVEYKKHIKPYMVEVQENYEILRKFISILNRKDTDLKILSPINGMNLSLNQCEEEANMIYNMQYYADFRRLVCSNASKLFDKDLF